MIQQIQEDIDARFQSTAQVRNIRLNENSMLYFVEQLLCLTRALDLNWLISHFEVFVEPLFSTPATERFNGKLKIKLTKVSLKT